MLSLCDKNKVENEKDNVVLNKKLQLKLWRTTCNSGLGVSTVAENIEQKTTAKSAKNNNNNGKVQAWAPLQTQRAWSQELRMNSMSVNTAANNKFPNYEQPNSWRGCECHGCVFAYLAVQVNERNSTIQQVCNSPSVDER